MGGRSTSSGIGRGGTPKITWNTRGTRDFLQGELDKYGLGITKTQLAQRVYRAAASAGAPAGIINDKYISIDGQNGRAEFSITKSTKDNKWKLTPMLGYGDVTRGRHLGQVMYHGAGQWFVRKEDAEWAVIRKILG